MLRRRFWLKAAMLSALAPISSVGLAQQAFSTNGAENIDATHLVELETQLKNGLRVVTPEQLQFVQLVVLRVRQGIVPRAMVNLLYKWALERNPKVPYPYFEYAMRALSKRRGIAL
ncbi:MAG: hypothetical protein KDB03_15405 [Planctomycetales bacterium]|nr:hypothetical protein [Planctomycetales bacterium]